MENKDTYTKQEVEDIVVNAVKLKDVYESLVRVYNDTKELNNEKKIFQDISQKLQRYAQRNVNDFVEDCNQKLPKSLINKLNIKKIE